MPTPTFQPCTREQFDIVKKLVFLDHCGPSGATGSFEEVADAVVKLTWNSHLHKRYSAEMIPFTDAEKRELMAAQQCLGYELPAFCNLMLTGFGADYFDSAFTFSPHKHFDLFLADLIHYLVSSMKLGQYAQETIEWFQQPRTTEELCQITPIPRIMFAAWWADAELQKRYDLTCEEGLLGWIGCFSIWTAPGIGGYKHPAWLSHFLDQPADFPYAKEAGLSNLMYSVYLSDPQIAEHHAIEDTTTAQQFAAVFASSFADKIPHYSPPAWLTTITPTTRTEG